MAARSTAIEANDGLDVTEGRDTRAPSAPARCAGRAASSARLPGTPALTCVRSRVEATGACAKAAKHDEEGKRSRENGERAHLHGFVAGPARRTSERRYEPRS